MRSNGGDGAQAGFSMIEYAILVAVVIAGVIVMERFMTGALGAKWRDAGDAFGGGQLCGPPECPE